MISNDRKNTTTKTYNLKKFVMTYFRRVGALVEEVGFELVEVLLPDELAVSLGGEMLLLAFDYEVAQENPDSIFLTYGSDLLDRIVQASLKMGRFIEFFWSQTEISLPAHLERSLITDFDFVKCKALILEAESANHCERELRKMEHYFAENVNSLNRRLKKTSDEARRERLQSQIAVTKADQQRREKDIRERYAVTARAELDGLVIYYQPKIELHLLLQQRNELFPFVLYYNPLDGRVEVPLCPHCHQPFRQIARDASGLPCCVDCRYTTETAQ